ncbi:hypothetical protein H5410_004450 [Solanum commersonii]|uniref:Uncharacterized protein n=1 Tax=Solanum commersonii TaxID=4109 RepID=A0A9J6B7E5_SOLCO|nr:hypothetical protein H5410_004450 [Solanum commersonii]
MALIRLKMSCKADLDDFNLDVNELLDVGLGGFDSDVDEYDNMNKRIQLSKEDYHAIKTMKIFLTLVRHQKRSAKPRRKSSVALTSSQPQFRKLVWAPSKHDVYLMSHFSEIHWSTLTWHVAPLLKNLEILLEGFMEILVSTLAVKDKWLFTSGLQGELIVKYLDKLGFQRVDLGGFDSDVDESQGIDLDDFDLDIDEFLCIDLCEFNSDVHKYDYMNKRTQDISVVEVRNDKGIQGIPKERLRNLVWAPSKHDVSLMSHFSIIDWSSFPCANIEILNLSRDEAPPENHPESFLEGFKET